MKQSTSKREHLIKASALALVVGLFTGIIFITDKLLAIRIKQGIKSDISRLPSALQKAAGNQEHGNYGASIREGTFTNQAVQDHRHHDASDYIKNGSQPSHQNIWIFGDSWGEGIKQNETQNKTLSKELNSDHNLRIIAASSFSTLLMHLAYVDRVKLTKSTPDIAVFFIDQTDIGDDFCRYRPYAFRDKKGQLKGVSHNNPLELRGGSTLNLYYKTLKPWNSGFLYLIATRINNWTSSEMGLPGITDCRYQDLMAYQAGNEFSPNGASTKDYEKYFKKSIAELAKRAQSLNPSTKIIFASHDWAQHSLPIGHPKYLPKNISTLLTKSADQLGSNVHHIHISDEADYPDSKTTNIYLFPQDEFSHLRDYSVLAEKIASKINNLNSQP